MSYTVVGLFPDHEKAVDASKRLSNAGFPADSYNVSKYKVSNDETVSEADDVDSYDYEEDQDTRSFWDKLFGTGDDAEYNRKAYGHASSKSNVVTVYTEDKVRAEEASQIMDDAGAINVDDHLPENFYSTNPEYSERRNRENLTDTNVDSNNIEVVKEDINVGKKEVSTGGVKIRSRIVERPVEEDVRLKEERVYIRRNPVDREVRNADNAFKDTTIEVEQSKEVPVVEKNARVVEEISLDKDVQEHTETVKDKVRETKIDIEDNTDGKTLDTDAKDLNS